MKTRNKCLLEKDEGCFYKHPKAKDGLNSSCKECVKHHKEIHRKHDHKEDERVLKETIKGNRWDTEKEKQCE